MLDAFYSLIAQAENTDTPAPAADNTNTAEDGTNPSADGAPAEGEGSPWGMMIPILLMFLVFYFVMMRPQKKRQEEHRKMMDTLKKNDRVQTIGGIIGTVVEVKDDNEVVIKIDESNNTKLRMARSAISRVINPDEKTAGEKA